MLKHIFYAAIVTVFALGTMVNAQQIHAQSNEQEASTSKSALAVSPAIIEEVLEPGKPKKFTLQVNNITNFPLPIKTMVRSFTVQSAELEKTERARLDASQWYAIQDPDFILQPNQVRKVTGEIRPPADAIPGGHYATIFFQPLIPQEALSPSTAYLNAQVGVLSFMIVKGDIEQEASYSDKLSTHGIVRGGPVRFNFSLHNSGNVHILPNGKLTIYDWRSNKVAELPLQAGIILPGAKKEYELQWDAPNAFGKYRAELQVSYGDDNISLQKNIVTFWVVPWLEILGIGTLFTLSTLFVLKTRHRWHAAWRALKERKI